MKTKRLEQLYFERFFGSPGRLLIDLENLAIEVQTAIGPAGSDLLEELLQRYTYISENQYRDSIYLIAEYIDMEFNLPDTLLCASTSDRHKDSGQTIVYDVCTALGYNHGHRKIHNLNRFDVAIKYIKNNNSNISSIILLDEFIGSGHSMLGRLNKLNNDSIQSKFTLPEIHILTIAAMNIGIKKLQPHVKSIYPCHALQQGIRGHLAHRDQAPAYKLIDQFENTLNPEIDKEKLPRRGWGECEALYARNFGNCPNSVFPMFWWPESSSGAKRKPPFSRVLSWNF